MNEKKQLSSGGGQMVDLFSVFLDVVKEWPYILLITVAAAIIGHVGLSRLRPPQYASYAVIALNNYNNATDLNNAGGADAYKNMEYEVNGALLLVEILHGSEIREAVSKDMGAAFSGSIAAEAVKETNFVKFTVKSRSALTSYLEARSLIRCLEQMGGDLLGGTTIDVLRGPRVQAGAINAGTNRKYVIAFAALAFLGACFVLAFLSYIRETVRGTSEVAGKVDAELLGTVGPMRTLPGRFFGRLSGGKKGKLITDPEVNARYAQDMRKVAVRIANEMAQEHRRVLLVSSALEGEGKTTVAANLALAMAECGRSVLLVDMDFRHPSLYKILRLQDAKFRDLGAFLAEGSGSRKSNPEGGARALLTKVPGTGLKAVLSRGPHPHAVEEYPAQIWRLLSDLREQADIVILDSSAEGLYSDSEELAMAADTSVIVVRENCAETAQIDRAIRSLGGRERMIGCIFNDARKSGVGANASIKQYGYWGDYAKE